MPDHRVTFRVGESGGRESKKVSQSPISGGRRSVGQVEKKY